jgi:hypothetical protein
MNTIVTIEDIINDKKLTEQELQTDLTNLKKYKADKNEIKFCGNKILYHFQLKNLLKTRTNKFTLSEILSNPEEYVKLENRVEKLGRTGTIANRFFEAYRFNQAVVFFKPATAKYIYKYFNAKSVLDPTAGWGGRMIGASALNIKYTGIDTNIELQDAYLGMMDLLQDKNQRMIWGDALKINFEDIDYDFVLTSPPYLSKKKLVEVYEHHPEYTDFYDDFLVPLIRKCMRYIKNNGKVCFNMSSDMYEIVASKFKHADMTLELPQQKRLSKDKKELIYIWIAW